MDLFMSLIYIIITYLDAKGNGRTEIAHFSAIILRTRGSHTEDNNRLSRQCVRLTRSVYYFWIYILDIISTKNRDLTNAWKIINKLYTVSSANTQWLTFEILGDENAHIFLHCSMLTRRSRLPLMLQRFHHFNYIQNLHFF